jgi:hypothetical protein
MDLAVTEAFEECIEPLVILGACVLAFAKPRPQVLPDGVVGMDADLREIVSSPAPNVLG